MVLTHEEEKTFGLKKYTGDPPPRSYGDFLKLVLQLCEPKHFCCLMPQESL